MKAIKIKIAILMILAMSMPNIVFAGAKAMFATDDGVSVMMNNSEKDTEPANHIQKHSQQKVARKKSIPNHHDDYKPYIGIQYWIDLQDGNGHSRQVTTSHTFHSGDHITLRIKSNSSGYLYVLNQDESGKPTPLYPTKRQNPFVQAGETYSIPNQGSIGFDDVPGNEKVIIHLSHYAFSPEQSDSRSLPSEAKVQLIPVSHNGCDQSENVGSKGMFVEESNANTDCTRKNDSTGVGSKGMFVEEDTVSAQPSSYAVIPTSDMQKKPLTVEFNLIHL